MTELAHFTAIDRTTLTRIADSLVQAGLAKRSSDAKDRRHVRLELTSEGVRRYRKAILVLFEMNDRLLEGVSRVSARAAVRVLQDIVCNLARNEAARNSILYYSREAPKTGAGRG